MSGRLRVARLAELALLLGAILSILLIDPVRDAIVPAIGFLATGQLAQFQRHLRALGPWAPIVSIVAMVGESLVVPVPVTINLVANGLVFGTGAGMLVSLAGGLLGASMAYCLARRFGLALVGRVLPRASLQAGCDVMGRHGRWALMVNRWIPGVPGDLMSYVAGLTKMPFRVFLIATLAGLVPSDLTAAYIGTKMAGDFPLTAWLAALAILVGAVLVWRAWLPADRSSPTVASADRLLAKARLRHLLRPSRS